MPTQSRSSHLTAATFVASNVPAKIKTNAAHFRPDGLILRVRNSRRNTQGT